MAKSVADLLVEVLLAAGVQRMYGVSGDSLNGITDAIRRREHMRWIHVRHEEAAAFAAGAEAHLTGKLAVCAGSYATHTIRIDRSKQLHEEPHTGHNRWHPDIPPVLRVDLGDTVVMETRDAFDGIITPTT